MLFSDETFFDHNNQDSAVSYLTISKIDADDVFFINGSKTFEFSSNDNTQYSKIPIIRKGQKYSVWGSEIFYDSIKSVGKDFLVQKDGLFNYYNCSKIPKYKYIGQFDGSYARFELPNGEKGYLKIDGSEIYD